MVTVIKYALRESKEGKPFISLELQGDLEMVQSMETGIRTAPASLWGVSKATTEQ